MPKLSIVASCYNEAANLDELYTRIVKTMSDLPAYEFEIILSDNGSVDNTAEVLRRIANTDKRVKVIINNRNFGHIRSGYYSLLQSTGDATVLMASDLEDPPEIIPQFVRVWETGEPVVLAQKHKSKDGWLFATMRRLFYRVLNNISEVELTNDATGFGLYSRRVVELFRQINDPYPYFRGLTADLGFKPAIVEFDQPRRARGVSSQNFYTLYDLAMLGFVKHSRIPLRVSVFLGFVAAGSSLVAGLGYLIAKLLFWNSMSMGLAPLVIGVYFLGAIQLIAIGILGEYIGVLFLRAKNHPIVVEKERINF